MAKSALDPIYKKSKFRNASFQTLPWKPFAPVGHLKIHKLWEDEFPPSRGTSLDNMVAEIDRKFIMSETYIVRKVLKISCKIIN